MNEQHILLVGLGYSKTDRLDMSAETKGIFDALYDKAKVEYLPNITFQSLKNRFTAANSSRISIFHYIGHSSLSGIHAEDNGKVEMIGNEFLKILLSSQRLHFVFLNSCFSKYLAETLHGNGVPIVIGTSSKVNNTDASIVATTFYKYLSGLDGSQTIQNAFDLTTSEMKRLQETGQLEKSYSFRGSGSIEENIEFAWNIYDKNATKEQRNWSLKSQNNNLGSFKEELLKKVDELLYNEVFSLIKKSEFRYDKPLFNILERSFAFRIESDSTDRLKVFINSLKEPY